MTSKADDEARRNTRASFEQWAQNPACQANTISAVHNVRMAEVARAEGYHDYGAPEHGGIMYVVPEQLVQGLSAALAP